MKEALAHLSKYDDVMAMLIADYPQPTFTAHTNYFQALVSSIISQQLSLAAAAKIEYRFKMLFEDHMPSPEQISSIDPQVLRSVGLSRQKAMYIQDLSQKILSNSIDLEDLSTKSNEVVISELTTVKGIGEWTAHMFLLFSMARLDILPVGDLGIRMGVKKMYKLVELPSPKQVSLISEKNSWQPYESVASWYLWQSLK